MLKRFAESNIGILILSIIPDTPFYVQLFSKGGDMSFETVTDLLFQRENILIGLGIYVGTVFILFVRKWILNKTRENRKMIYLSNRYHEERLTKTIAALQTHFKQNDKEHDEIMKGIDKVSFQITQNMKNNVHDQYAKFNAEIDEMINILSEYIEKKFQDSIANDYKEMMKNLKENECSRNQ